MSERFYPTERRSGQRFSVPGATVHMAPAKDSPVRFIAQQTASVLNLSTVGLSVGTDEPLPLGVRLVLALHIPGREPIPLAGQVVWRGTRRATPAHLYGVEFAPFGQAAGDNPPQTLDLLKALEAECLKQGA